MGTSRESAGSAKGTAEGLGESVYLELRSFKAAFLFAFCLPRE